MRGLPVGQVGGRSVYRKDRPRSLRYLGHSRNHGRRALRAGERGRKLTILSEFFQEILPSVFLKGLVGEGEKQR